MEMGLQRAEYIDVPRSAPIDGVGAARLLNEWLRRPSLKAATLISFAVSPLENWEHGSEMISSSLCRVASQAETTLVTSDSGLYDGGRRGDERLRALEVLRRAGVRVLIHRLLHAKIYLLEDDGRKCWIVGSSNLTLGGMRENVEVNVRGFHSSDYQTVAVAAEAVIAEARPF